MAYQSFDNDKGDSNSAAKLAAINLPADLTGKSVLDIGCNEGYFCKAALERGATRVVGIDVNPNLIEKAKQRVPDAEFKTASWWSIDGSEKFDFILFLSAIHYEVEQARLLSLIRHALKKSGVLILECGIAATGQTKEWQVVQRHDGILRYPTVRLLKEELLYGYAVRNTGPSVPQAGDPVARMVFHASPISPTILAIGGRSGSGKTTLASNFQRHGVLVLSSDELILRVRTQYKHLNDVFVKFVLKSLESERHLDKFTEQIVTHSMIDSFCEYLLRFITPNEDLTVVEGYQFNYPEFRASFERLANRKGFRVVYALL